ncbi:MAG: hypothetical protein M0R06_16935 [Sphaerochaeta sp.]|jgi:predicted DNA binding CopG/RHH family protein|nr:hypothetical protein [Sphaerochaeta sp.]
MDKQTINIRLERSLWRQVKITAAVQGVTLQDWLTLAIIKMLSDKAEDSK